MFITLAGCGGTNSAGPPGQPAAGVSVARATVEQAKGQNMQTATEAQVIDAAKEFARSKGMQVEKYQVRSVRASGSITRVLFHNEQGTPGDHFTVTVDNTNGKATGFQPGM
jgi:hypothetical protein